jgi:hypothetical protein
MCRWPPVNRKEIKNASISRQAPRPRNYYRIFIRRRSGFAGSRGGHGGEYR